MKKLALLLLLILTNMAHGQVAQLRMPSKVSVGTKVIAVCEAQTPENIKLMILWDYSDRLEVEKAATGDRLFIWGKPGRYVVEAIIIPLRSITVQEQTFDVVAGNISRVKGLLQITGSTDPDPPDPGEVPFDAPGFAVMVLKEAQTMGQLPPSQQAIFSSPKVLNWLKTNCVKIGDPPTPMFRFWDDDYTDEYLRNVDPLLKNAYSATKTLSGGEVPWISISNAPVGFSGPLPLTVDQTIQLLEKYK